MVHYAQVQINGPAAHRRATTPEFRDGIGTPVHRDRPNWKCGCNS
jgi:hypothetical protein